MRSWIDLTGQALDLEKVLDFIARPGEPSVGGVNCFLGITRGETSTTGSSLLALDYESYAEMATAHMHRLAEQAGQRWRILRLALLHRVGRVAVGEPSIVIAVATPHRAEAFDACRWLIDTLKAEVPIWKREVWADGPGDWVEGNPVKTQT
jgi:molybdopterin synthase catalytic subunit